MLTAEQEFVRPSRPIADPRAAQRRSPAYVRWVQQSLNRAMGTRMYVNGVMGPRVSNAVRAFQGRAGLTTDGVVGPRTEAALIAAGAGNPPSSARPAAPGATRPPRQAAPSGGLIGLPSSGEGYYSYSANLQQYGHPATIRAIQSIGAAWQQARPRGPRIGIGDLSIRGGGPMRGHASHKHGLDVDIRPLRADGRDAPTTIKSPEYSRALTQALVNMIRSNGVLRVQYIFFNDPSIQGVRRWPGHDNHLHVRFFAPGARTTREVSDGESDGEVNRRSTAYVQWVQAALNRISGAGLTVDGVLGPRTRAAIQAFQRQRGLAVDGIVGPRTEAALITAGAGNPPSSSVAPTSRPGRAQVLCQLPTDMTGPERTAASVTTRFETGVPFGCVVSATDGISMGMLQWNLLAGTLQNMLNRFEQQNGRLRSFFGADLDRVQRLIALRNTRAERERAVAEAKAENLASRWREPLLRLCADQQFCGMLMLDVRQRMRLAQNAARRLGLQTTRGLTMMFDIVVGDGLGKNNSKLNAFATRIDNQSRARGQALTEQEKLVEIADEAARFAGRWSAERRARRLLIANGSGTYRGSQWNLDRDFPTLNERGQ
jgi:peptidoglycan hydrolase-like protein with peptidoglycan-binding domain